jgi:transcriptional regulator with XRE-family HTH domain
MYYIVLMKRTFGKYVRKIREHRRLQSSEFSVRKVAIRIGIEPSYLSKVERDDVAPPSEATILRLAEALEEDPDLLLAMAGKVSSDLRTVILNRPQLFAELIRQLKDAPDHAVLRIAREVRDGNW